MNSLFILDAEKIFDQDNSQSIIKQILQQNYDDLKQQFDPQENVNQLLKKHSAFVDKILSVCWKHFLKQYATKLSLIATGGYGRNELFPNSDIDILILLENEEISAFQDSLSGFSNFLWDIGLKPGQCVRTIAECVETATEDQTILTSLLETRLLCGNQTLFSELTKTIASKKLWTSEDYFTAKMREQKSRYTKYHDTAYNLEPNIKEGPGGLRDLQNIAWVFKYHYEPSSLKELVKYGFFSESEYAELVACRNVLWRIRFALHAHTQSSEDRLLFDYQRELANQFGFLNEDKHPDVEQFMQFYFRTVMKLERMNEMLLQLFKEELENHGQIKELYPVNEYFVSINGYLEAKTEDIFSKQPLALLKIFTLLQNNHSLKGVRASTIRLIHKNIHLIDDAFRENVNANQLFLAILKSSSGITDQLRRMNRYGILAAYIPAFSSIVARMQYDLFHIYTVDAHTLFVVRNLRRFSLEKHSNEVPFCNSVFTRIKNPEILYITALFHDIAKGLGGDHSVLGEKIVIHFCAQHKLSRRNTKLIAWLVRNHLVMSMTAQRKDISDPDVIYEFAQQVGSIEYLNHLYLFTVADIRSTNPSLWTSWKGSLLSDLYTITHSAIRRGIQNPIAKSERIEDIKHEAKEELFGLGISEATIDKTWNRLNDDYFLRYSANEISWHTIVIASSTEDDLPLVILRPQTQRDSVEILIYSKHIDDIFSISAGTLDHLGLSILDARIITIKPENKLEDEYVLNTFQVLEQAKDPFLSLDRELRICNVLRNNLQSHNVSEQRNILRQSRQAKHFPIKSKINFHKDPLNRYTIIELITTDHAGLLASVGEAFIELGLQLHDAKITTIGSRVEDMFYISDLQSKPITEEEKLVMIRDKLISILQESGES